MTSTRNYLLEYLIEKNGVKNLRLNYIVLKTGTFHDG